MPHPAHVANIHKTLCNRRAFFCFPGTSNDRRVIHSILHCPKHPLQPLNEFPLRLYLRESRFQAPLPYQYPKKRCILSLSCLETGCAEIPVETKWAAVDAFGGLSLNRHSFLPVLTAFAGRTSARGFQRVKSVDHSREAATLLEAADTSRAPSSSPLSPSFMPRSVARCMEGIASLH
jgi:hypothetical protein